MTVENLFTLLGASQMAPGAFGDVGSRAIQIPVPRRRHPSLGSTGSNYDSGGSLAGSPPIQELLTLHLSQQVLSGSPRSQGALDHLLYAEAGQGSRKSSINPTRYKTELCRPFEESGYCKYGEKCQFAHGREELRSLSRHPKYKTELCRTYHTSGFCPYGPRCHFIHNEDEEKLNRINQQKHQQILQRVAQHVAQQQVLCQLSGQAACGEMLAPVAAPVILQHPPVQQLNAVDLDLAIRLGSTADTPPASITDSPPSLSPVSSAPGHDDLLASIPTPPPGFTAPPPVYQKTQPIPLSTFASSLDAALPSPSTVPSSATPSVTPPCPNFGLPFLFQNEQPASLPSSPSRLPIFSRLGV